MVGAVEASGGNARRQESAAQRRRSLFTGLVTLLVAAYPLAWAASLAHASLSGCWLTCGGDPNPVVGALWAIVAAALLAAPVGVAMSKARVRSWAAWVTAALAVLLAVGAWVVFSLDPANAEFFVKLGE